MAKKRTRKQKETAKHRFSLAPNTGAGFKLSKERLGKLASTDGYVKGQFKKGSKTLKSRKAKGEKAKDTAKPSESASIKRDIARSVFLASLILSLEVVIYFVLR